MSKKKRGNKDNKRGNKDNTISLKEPAEEKNIKKSLLENYNYPIFCFKYLSDRSYKDCNNVKFFKSYLNRLQRLSELGWVEIRKSDKHQYGLEKIPIINIKPATPSIITPEVTSLDVFRATGDKHPFVGHLNKDNIFQVFFIEATFGDIYDHD